ncbi:MAG TPA: hypothetical protein VGG42_09840 [Acidobacteriaceae bacterium]|jgi:hypothetical protein
MADLQAGVGAIAVAIEQVYKDPQLIAEQDSELVGMIADNGRAEPVSAHTFRITFQDQVPAEESAINLDNAAVNFPAPGSSDWQAGTITPVSRALPIGWTKLAELAGKPELTVVNIVAKQMADIIREAAKRCDIHLCAGDGTGFIGNITAVDAGNWILTMNDADFGARLITKGQHFDVYNGLNFVTTVKAAAVTKNGPTQTVSLDNQVGNINAIAAGYIARVSGLTSGSPVYVYGIPYWVSNTPLGLTAGIDRSVPANNFILASGTNANNSEMTPPLLRLPFDSIKAILGLKAVKSGKFRLQWGPAQAAMYEQLAGQFFQITKQDGKLGTWDLLGEEGGSGSTVGGNKPLENIHAHNEQVTYLMMDRWNKIQYGNLPSPWWFTWDGRRVFPQIGTNGMPTAGAVSYLVDTRQFFVDNPPSQASLYSLALPPGY